MNKSNIYFRVKEIPLKEKVYYKVEQSPVGVALTRLWILGVGLAVIHIWVMEAYVIPTFKLYYPTYLYWVVGLLTIFWFPILMQNKVPNEKELNQNNRIIE